MPHAYTENQHVEQPVVGLFQARGWDTISAIGTLCCPAAPVPSQPNPGDAFTEVYAERSARGLTVDSDGGRSDE